MTIEDFSNSFDTLLNSYAFKSDYGDSGSALDIILDEYEKSVFLTLAQEQIVRELLGDMSTRALTSLEENKILNLGLTSLLQVKEIGVSSLKYSERGSHAYSLNENKIDTFASSLAILDEVMYSIDSKTRSSYTVIPISFAEYQAKRSKPYGGPNRRHAWRVKTSGTVADSEELLIVTPESLGEPPTKWKYQCTYIAVPDPIILTTLGNGLNINDKTAVAGCTLPVALHYAILERAVNLAIKAKADKLAVARQLAQQEANASNT